MSFLFSFNKAKSSVDPVQQQIATDAKAIKKEATKLLNAASKQLEKKVNTLNKEILLATTNNQKESLRVKKNKIKQLKQEIIGIKAKLGQVGNDSGQAVKCAEEALSKIMDINSEQHSVVNILELQGSIKQLHQKMSDTVKELFVSFKKRAAETSNENFIATLALGNTINQLGSAILETSSAADRVKSYSEATSLNEILDAQKSLDELQENFNENSAIVNELPEKEKAPLLKQIAEFSLKINGLQKQLSKGNISSKDAERFKSEANKLELNAGKLLDKISGLPAFSAAEKARAARKAAIAPSLKKSKKNDGISERVIKAYNPETEVPQIKSLTQEELKNLREDAESLQKDIERILRRYKRTKYSVGQVLGEAGKEWLERMENDHARLDNLAATSSSEDIQRNVHNLRRLKTQAEQFQEALESAILNDEKNSI